MKRLITTSVLASVLCGLLLVASFASGDDGFPSNGSSQSGKGLTIRVPVTLCGEWHSGADQIFAKVGCKEPLERPYDGYYIVGVDLCNGSGDEGNGREVELVRNVGGTKSVYESAAISADQGAVGEIFDPIYTGGPLRFPPGFYTLRAKQLSYREKVWEKSGNVYYHGAKIICEGAEFTLGNPPPDYTGGGPST